MKLPANLVIAFEKLTQYLLVPQAREDKSAFLRSAGYTLSNPGDLLRDLRDLARHSDATLQESNAYGDFYEVRGRLFGPSGAVIDVCTIWMTERLSKRTKFITLFPNKQAWKP